MRIVWLALIVKVFLSQLSHATSLVNNKQDLNGRNYYTVMESHRYASKFSIKEESLSGREVDIKLSNIPDDAEALVTNENQEEIIFICCQMSVPYWNETLHLQQKILQADLIEKPMLDFFKTFFSGSIKIIFHNPRVNSLIPKIIFLLMLRVLLKGSCQTELQFLSIAFLNLDLSFGTMISPSPSFSMTSWQTSTISSHVGNHLNATYVGDLVPSSSVRSASSVETQDVEKVLEATNKVSYRRGECDMGWIQLGNYCYLPSTEPMFFDHAQRACSYHSANLVSVTKKSENELIFNISRDYFGFPKRTFVWLGMERREATSKLHWIDENDLKYQNWILGEPDSNGACVQMIMKGLWEDCTCFEKNHFICKKRSSYPPPYSRSTELGILIGIPFIFAFIVLSFVTILIFKSIRDADDTFYGYGKNRNKEKMHAALVDVSASIAHVSTQRRQSEAIQSSRSQSLSSSRVNPAVDVSDTGSQSPIPAHVNPKVEISDADVPQSRDNHGVDVYDILQFPIQNRKKATENRVPEPPRAEADPEAIEMQVCGSAISLEKEPSQFQSTTSLDYLVSKSYFKPKSRKLRGLKKPETTVRLPGRDGVYRKKTSV